MCGRHGIPKGICCRIPFGRGVGGDPPTPDTMRNALRWAGELGGDLPQEQNVEMYILINIDL